MEIADFTKFCLYIGHIFLCLKLTRLSKFRRKCPRELLLDVISQTLASGEVRTEEIKPFSYFSQLLISLLRFRQNFGADINESLRSLRQLIIYEGQLQRKLSSEIRQACGQFLILFLMTWVFIVSTYWQLSVIFEVSFYAMIFCWQSIGVLVFFIFLQKNKRRLFKNYEDFQQAIFTLKSLIGVGPSVKQVIELANLGTLNKSGEKFAYVKNGLESFLQNIQLQGRVETQFLEEISQELDFLWHQDQEKFQRIALRLKFIVLLGFFLATYLLYLFALFQKLLP